MRFLLLLLTFVALLPGLSGCDWIKSLWGGEPSKPAVGALVTPPSTKPAAGGSDTAKADVAALEAPKPNADAALGERVKAALGEDPDLKLLGIDARASEGVVTLYGTANTLANREKAARLASAVPGVKSVRNQLVIVAGS